MNLFDAVYRKLTGRSPRSESSVRVRVSRMERVHGTQKAAAKAAGIPLRTWQRWKAGEGKPKAENNKKLTKAYRESLVPKGRRERVKKSTRPMQPGQAASGGFTIRGNVTVSSDTRRRTLKLGQHLPEGAMEEVMNAILSGEDEQAKELLTEMLEEYGSSFGAEISLDVDSISIDPVD